jgi:hypothetical protein
MKKWANKLKRVFSKEAVLMTKKHEEILNVSDLKKYKSNPN